MNKLQGIITEVTQEGHLCIARVDVAGVLFTALAVDDAITTPYIIAGNEVRVLFKESEVAVAKNFSGLISMQNQIPCKIAAIEPGITLCGVFMNNGAFDIKSIITARAAAQLSLAPGDEVTAMIKTNEIMLMPL